MSAYRASELPPGFRLTLSAAETLGGAGEPASHLVYSDGLATVSVFVEPERAARQPQPGKPGRDVKVGTPEGEPRAEEPPMHGLARVGSGYAFSTMVQGHEVTAVGEVPAQTVEFIAHAVKSGGDLRPH